LEEKASVEAVAAETEAEAELAQPE